MVNCVTLIKGAFLVCQIIEAQMSLSRAIHILIAAFLPVIIIVHFSTLYVKLHLAAYFY